MKLPGPNTLAYFARAPVTIKKNTFFAGDEERKFYEIGTRMTTKSRRLIPTAEIVATA